MIERSSDIRAIVALYDGQNEEQLFEMIGKYDPDAIYALPQNSTHLVEAGRQWFASRSEEIKRFVCSRVEPKDVSKPISEELVGLVFGYLAAPYGKALAAYATALVLKKLVQGWCGAGAEDNT